MKRRRLDCESKCWYKVHYKLCQDHDVEWATPGTEHWVLPQLNTQWYTSLPAHSRSLIYVLELIRPVKNIERGTEEYLDVCLDIAKSFVRFYGSDLQLMQSCSLELSRIISFVANN